MKLFQRELLNFIPKEGWLTGEHFVEFSWWGVFYEIGSYSYLCLEKNYSRLLTTGRNLFFRMSRVRLILYLFVIRDGCIVISHDIFSTDLDWSRRTPGNESKMAAFGTGTEMHSGADVGRPSTVTIYGRFTDGRKTGHGTDCHSYRKGFKLRKNEIFNKVYMGA